MSSFPMFCCILFLLTHHPGAQPSPLPFPVPGVPRPDHPLAKCKDCGGQELGAHIKQNIKQMQTLHIFRSRIMNAINRPQNVLPMSDARPKPAGSSTGVPSESVAAAGSGGSDSGSASGGGQHVLSSTHRVTVSTRSSSKKTGGRTAIFSLSKVVSSSRRKNVLQFTLNPAERQKGMVEVVKAHLWLLLGRSHRRSGKGKGKVMMTGHRKNDSDIMQTTRSRREAENSKNDTVGGKDEAVAGGENNKEERTKTRKESKDKKERNEDKEKEKEDRKEAKTESSVDKTQKKAVVRILLVEADGRKKLLTYLRTSVKKTHWHKLSLPVGLVQQYLQQNNPTLTLMLRCSRCGRSTRMFSQMPKALKSRVKMSRKQTSRKGRRRENRRWGKRQRKDARLRAGRERYSLRKAKRHFRPSAVLVINTRERPLQAAN
ncbi:hypothetical protein BaRGS_00019227 [Batillaria attramentaria]|uniref:Uncharacterized protein n=1 Tax=Batillaria attramentaria TaxID=370345 RepID=A0ABD0KQR5_9CAEN